MKAADSSSSMPHTLSFKAAYTSSSYTEKESLRSMPTLPNFTGVLKAADTSSLRLKASYNELKAADTSSLRRKASYTELKAADTSS